MRFTKMHGIGNDYIYINGFEDRVDDPSALARRLCDRHTAIGGDGLILVLPAEAASAHVRMRMFNVDGSEAEMCGNGIRCLCKFAHDRGLIDANPMLVQTARSVLSLQYTTDEAGKVDQVTVDMGEPIFDTQRIGVRIEDLSRIINHSVRSLMHWPPQLPAGWDRACGLDQRMTCVSVGNPHAVFYCEDVAAIPLETVGPVVENHPVFPDRINVHFAQVASPTELTMRTWERGSGITQACGTGATAVCAAGSITDRTDREILAHLPGGDLHLHWRTDDKHVYMTGPATEIYTGEWAD